MQDKRNIRLHLTPQLKERLESLARKSEMTLNQYIAAVLKEAIGGTTIFHRQPSSLN